MLCCWERGCGRVVLQRRGSLQGYAAAPKEMTLRKAPNAVLDEEMSADASLFLMGEEVGEYQRALQSQRLVSLELKSALLSMVSGLVEFMTFNFAMQAIDHTINCATKMIHMSAGNVSVPIVSRGAAAGVGAQYFQAL